MTSRSFAWLVFWQCDSLKKTCEILYYEGSVYVRYYIMRALCMSDTIL